MNFLARIVRFLFWLLVLSWGLRLLRRILSGIVEDQTAPAPETPRVSQETTDQAAARRLVRDPVCGMHVDETLAIPFGDAGEVLHFCSPACRDAYAANVRKFAANG